MVLVTYSTFEENTTFTTCSTQSFDNKDRSNEPSRFTAHLNCTCWPDSCQNLTSSDHYIHQFSFSSADPYYSQAKSAKTKPVSLSSALDEIMMDMSSSSTIVECYCGQNSCPQCNLLLKMAGSDTQIRIFSNDTFFLQILRCLQMSSYLYFSRS